MAVAGRLLLLDLDGVVVYEAGPPLVPVRSLFSLHDDMQATIRALDMPVVVLTHRSRREASVILQSAGVALDSLGGVIAAEDLLLQAVMSGRLIQLGRRGLAKSFALPYVERVFKVGRPNVAFIDDKLQNLEDLLAHGVGLALHAPSAVDGARLVTFNIASAVSALQQWRRGELETSLVSLPPQSRPFASYATSGISTRAVERHTFNRMRRAAFRLRTRLTRRA